MGSIYFLLSWKLITQINPQKAGVRFVSLVSGKNSKPVIFTLFEIKDFVGGSFYIFKREQRSNQG